VRTPSTCPTLIHFAALSGALALAPLASAQWITYANQTSTRMPTGAGLNSPSTSTACPEEKDYAWGDVDHDGDLDVVCMRKRPLSCPGGRPNVLFMNENGILIDRTTVYAAAANGVPVAQGVSQGFLDSTNDRQAVLVDVNNDGWLDIVTCTTMSDGTAQYIGHPRVYMNLGADGGGNWLGFQYDYDRIPTLPNKSGAFLDSTPPITSWYQPRFCSVAAGDVNGDGYVDLYFSDYDTPEAAYCQFISEIASHDMDNKLLVNQGASNPGFFNDETNARMSVTCGCGGNLNFTAFGAHGLICDMNGDGLKDIVKLSTLGSPQHVAVIQNNMANPGNWTGTTGKYKAVYSLAPYFVAADDLNGNGTLDLVLSDDSNDRWGTNTGNDVNGNPNITSIALNTENEFSGPSLIADLDNDGWKDFIIWDQDIDTNYQTSRRGRVYHNRSPSVSPQFAEETSPTYVLPQTSNKAVYNGAIFDINGDGWLDIILGKGNPAGGHTIGSTEVWMGNGKHDAVITYPSDRPLQLTPDADTTFPVQIVPGHGGTLSAGRIHISVDGGPFTQTPLMNLGGNQYQATIPAQPCGTGVQYYLSALMTNGSSTLDPPAATYNGATPTSTYLAYVAATTETALAEDFEGAAAGWTVQSDGGLTAGAWQLAAPNGTWNEGFRAAPHQAAGGSQAFVTQNGSPGGSVGAADVDGGSTHLLSPVVDLSSGNGVVTYSRWFYSSTAGDVLQVSVSNDGGSNWTTVKTIKPHRVMNWSADSNYQQTAWITESFNVGDYVEPTSQVRVRFTVADALPAGIVEAGIDNVNIQGIPCAKGPACPADVNGDTQVNVADLLAVIGTWGPCVGCPSDINGDDVVNVADLLAVISAWGACP
jgi:hypothetical protein